jgi:steroid 5-alpha reductase family enzyme
MLRILLIAFTIQWVAFIPAFIFQTEKFYDLIGSITYLSVCVYSLFATQSIQNASYGNLLLAGAIIVWAVRLGSFLFARVHKTGKDGRFDSIKTSYSQFLMTWTLQGMWVFICSSAALVAIFSPTGVVVNNVFIVGLAVFIIGFAIEVIADNQKSKFRLDEKNRNMFINEGLWSRSRHPNYFGEIMLWTGITIMSIPSFVGLNFLALFSPVFTYLLLNHISGVRILEARGNEKWGKLAEYQEYKKQTPKLIPKIFS